MKFVREEYLVTILCLSLVFVNTNARRAAAVAVLWSILLHALLAFMAQLKVSHKARGITRRVSMITALALFSDALGSSSLEVSNDH